MKDLLGVFGAVGVGVLIAIYGQYKYVMGREKIYKDRNREDFHTVEDWLMSNYQKKSIIKTKNEKNTTVVSCNTAAYEKTFDYTIVPKLRIDGPSHIYNILGEKVTSFIFPDIQIKIPPIEINAPIDLVWDILMDFKNYEKWNPFHLRADVVENESNQIFLGLKVKMGGALGTIYSNEEMYYVDSSRFVFIYGIGLKVPSSMRTVWLESIDKTITIMNSYDTIGGYAAWLCKFYIEKLTYNGFNNQHKALKLYAENIFKAQQAE